jgi:hypothetical protein
MKTKLMFLLILSLAACGRHRTVVGMPGPKGATGNSGAPGSAGSPGNNGANGQNGTNGHNAVVEQAPASGCSNGGTTILSATDLNDNGFIDVDDSNILSAQLCNGQDGNNAPPTTFTPVALLNPCGVGTTYDEVLLRLQNGQVLASFSNNTAGDFTRFSLLLPNVQYMTTDSDACFFKIDPNGFLYNEHH